MSGFAKRIEARMKRKEAEIHDLQEQREKLIRAAREIEAQINAAQAASQAFAESLAILGGPERAASAATRELRAGSLPALAYEALKATGKPLHITELIHLIERDGVSRQTLVGSLSAYVRDENIFSRPAPNTFGLLEWEEAEQAQVATFEASQEEPE
jgi:hypothetical protein